MKKTLAVLLILVLLPILPLTALAQGYQLDLIHALIDVPDSYALVLTPQNLEANINMLTMRDMDVEDTAAVFESNGILLAAYDDANSRTFILSALKTVDAEMYFDLNEQDSDMRKEFRTSHTNGSAWGLLGYTYSHATWTNYGGTKLRFLCTEYTFRENGAIEHYGYQRRTIRNGYLITLDMQVRGRTLKSSDEKALEALLSAFSFTVVEPMPQLPVRLTLTQEPPASLSTDQFTIKGTAVKKASVSVTVLSLTSGMSSVFNETANSSGSFSVKVTLPAPGVYTVVLNAEADGYLRTQFTYSVSYIVQ